MISVVRFKFDFETAVAAQTELTCLFPYLHSHERYETIHTDILGTQYLFAGDLMEKWLVFFFFFYFHKCKLNFSCELSFK